MAKPIMVKCHKCGKLIEKDKAYNPTNRIYYCDKKCYANYLQDKKSPPKPKKDPKPVEGSELRDMTDYIQALYIEQGIDKKRINWEMIIKQAKNIIATQDDNWSYYTIQYVLEYMKDVAHVNLFDFEQGSILNLVPYYGKEAKAYFFENKAIADSVRESNIEFTTTTIETSVNSSPRFKKITF